MTEKKIRVTIIISNVDKAVGFEWLVDRIDRRRFELSFILLNEKPSQLADYLRSADIEISELSFTSKKDLPGLVLKTTALLRRLRPDVIHTHLFAANLVGHTAARLLGIRKRIYTRHSSNENRRYHGKQRYDKIVNSLATHVIAISRNVRNVLEKEEGVPPSKIVDLHHGFDLDQFDQVTDGEVTDLTERYNPGGKRPVIGVIARYSHWKGIQHIIPAFKKLLADRPDALLMLANAKRGDYARELSELLRTLPEDSYREIEFESNIFALYRLFDVYVHTPIDAELEAFGQTYVEALAAGTPSVFTLSGVAPEFIEHERNALVVNFESPDEIHTAIDRLLDDDSLRKHLIENGRKDIRPMFEIDTMIKRLEEIYAE